MKSRNNDTITIWGIVISFTVLLIVTNLGVLMRYLLNYPLGWVDEMGRYLFVFLVFLGAAVGVKRRSHIRLDMLRNRLPPKIARLYDLVGFAISSAFLIFLIVVGLKNLKLGFMQKTMLMEIPLGYVYLAIPVGCLLMLFNLIRGFFDKKGG